MLGQAAYHQPSGFLPPASRTLVSATSTTLQSACVPCMPLETANACSDTSVCAVVETELEDLEARVVQHEMDHLDGVVFLDRMGPIKRDLLKRKIKKAIKAGDYETT